MNLTAAVPSPTATRDEDLAEQARAGHGIPSQDPDPAAQVPLKPGEAEREAKSVLAGGGVVGGVALGAAIGVAIGGPVGVLVGGTLGAVAGAVGGIAAGTVMSPSDSNSANPAVEDSAPSLRDREAMSSGTKP